MKKKNEEDKCLLPIYQSIHELNLTEIYKVKNYVNERIDVLENGTVAERKARGLEFLIKMIVKFEELKKQMRKGFIVIVDHDDYGKLVVKEININRRNKTIFLNCGDTLDSSLEYSVDDLYSDLYNFENKKQLEKYLSRFLVYKKV